MAHRQLVHQQGVDELVRAGIAASRGPNSSSSTRSTPASRIAPSFSRSRVSRDGARSGAKYSSGCGSKVTTVAGSPSRSPLGQQLAKHRLMPEVDTIEVADGGHRAAGAPAADCAILE